MTSLDNPVTNGDATAVKRLWQPSFPENTRIHKFMSLVSQKNGRQLNSYHDLWEWSISEPSAFWEEIWYFTGVKAQKSYDKVYIHAVLSISFTLSLQLAFYISPSTPSPPHQTKQFRILQFANLPRHPSLRF